VGNLKYIFAQPDYIEGVDKDNPIILYPIKLKDHDKFEECSELLYLSKNHFAEVDMPLLSLLFMAREQLKLTIEELIEKLSKLFSLVTQKTVNFISSDQIEGFIVDNTNIISTHNYDEIRKIIMKQNLMFDQKVYKDPLVQEWANKVLLSRQKKNAKITLEDMITTVKSYQGITYQQIMEQTIYQLYADFYRIGQIMQFEQASLFSTVSMEKITIEYFAQNIDMFKSPYDDLFVSSSKLNKFNTITK
jgi:hypothetical protein